MNKWVNRTNNKNIFKTWNFIIFIEDAKKCQKVCFFRLKLARGGKLPTTHAPELTIEIVPKQYFS